MKNFKNIVFLLTSGIVLAQSPAISWQKRFGSTNGDIARTMKPTADGGYIMGGYSLSDAGYEKNGYCRGGADYWVIKTNGSGTIEWDKTIGGAQTPGQFPSYENDVMRSVIQTPDGGYLLGGNSSSPISGEKTENCRGDYDFWIVKLSPTGVIQWQKTIGGSQLDEVSNAINTQDGGYLVAGVSVSGISGEKTDVCRGNSDVWVIKLSVSGSIEWQKTIGGSGFEGAEYVIQDVDGSYIVAATSNSDISGEKTEDSRGGSDVWLLKIDGAGNLIKQKTIGGSGSDEATGIIATNDGGFMVTAVSSSPVSGEKTGYCRGGDDCWLIKTDAEFNIVWQKTYGGNNDEYCQNPFQSNDNGYLILSSSRSGISGEKTTPVSGYTDAWILKLSQTGEIQWQKTIGGNAPGNIYANDGFLNAAQAPDGGFVLFGTTDSEISGDIVDFPRGGSDYWMVKLAPEILTTSGFDTATVSVYPNPTVKTVHIGFPETYKNLTATITSVTGQVVGSKTFGNTSKFDLDINGQAGLYFVAVVNENQEKVVLKVMKD